LVAAAQRRRAPIALSWDHLFVPEPVPVVAATPAAVAATVAEPVPVVGATPAVVAEVVDAIEAEFWADDGRPDRWLRVRRTVGTVGLQAVAVLLVLAAVLIRIG
ncbi:MAG: hypothetical protein EBU70_15450, partial [Actinobacteria bacterium]|nr:hypothetical protein [Actinomycetota bacterium]